MRVSTRLSVFTRTSVNVSSQTTLERFIQFSLQKWIFGKSEIILRNKYVDVMKASINTMVNADRILKLGHLQSIHELRSRFNFSHVFVSCTHLFQILLNIYIWTIRSLISEATPGRHVGRFLNYTKNSWSWLCASTSALTWTKTGQKTSICGQCR
jgi:hypothetical protein